MKRTLSVLIAMIALGAGALPATASAAPPTGVTGFAGDSRVELSWQPAAGATGYRVYRGTSPTAITTPVTLSVLVPPDLSAPTSFVDTTAVNGTTYYYAVRTVTNGVESANSRVVRARPAAATCSTGNAVVRENCRPGDSSWILRGGTSGAAIEGYATEQSVNKGGSVGLKINGSGSTTYDIEIYRSGYYGGSGARLVSTIMDVPLQLQPACSTDATTGLIDCSAWSVSETVTTTGNWPSGIYLVRLVRDDNGRDAHVLFVVRDDQRDADILFGVPFTTYQAYNNYGGKSLYDWNSAPPNTVANATRAVKVSFDRPFAQAQQGGDRDWYTRADVATVRWLEWMGYDVSYHSVSDLERQGAEVRDHRVYISAAHDEYYSAGMRTALQQARDAGTDLFFTGSNEIYWKVRFEPSPVSGRQDRVLVTYKSTQSGGPDPSGIPTGTWRDPAGANNPENALTGVMYVGDRDFTYFPLVVTAENGRDRVWRYTGLENQPNGTSTAIGSGLVGWEWDARVANGREPPGVTTLSESPVNGNLVQNHGRDYVTGTAVAHAAKYTAPSGALVVTTGTNHWNRGLAFNMVNDGEPDLRIQQATTNILADMGVAPATPPSNIRLDDPSGAPLVLGRAPEPGSTNAGTSTTVRAVFSRAMNAATINTSTFTLRRSDGTAVSASVTYDANNFTAILTPNSPLSTNTSYNVRLDGSITASNGVPLGGAVTWSFTTAPPDTTNPTVSITAPQDGERVTGDVTVAATAADNIEVDQVQFRLDGQNLGAPDTTAPYSINWDSSSASQGAHRLTAVARDTSGNQATSAPVDVVVDHSGLVAAYGFEETSGSGVVDSSGLGNGGTISGATRSTAGRFGNALSFDGVNDWVTVPDSSSLDLGTQMTVEAWVRPTTTSDWRTVLIKEQPNNLVYALYSSSENGRPSGWVFTNTDSDVRTSTTLPTNDWSHLALTYDGSNVRLYVNGQLSGTAAAAGSLTASSGALRIGGNQIWGEYFGGLIDEVRIYRRALSAGEIQSDMNAAIIPPVADTQPPTTPSGLSATGGLGQASLSWSASSDNVGVDHYDVHRGSSAGFTVSAANRIAQPSGTSYTDQSAPAGTWHYRVVAVDAAGNASAPSASVSAVVTSDTAGPTVAISAPSSGATVSGTTDLRATASDNVGVAGVQFRVDGTNVGAEDTTAPYEVAWDTSTVGNGQHTVTAVARDGAGNTTTSAPVTVTVSNQAADPSGLVAAFGFEETGGTGVTDSSGRGNNGTISGATRSTTGRFGRALSFDGSNDWVTVPDSSSLDLTTAMTLEAWVRPTTTSNWRTVLLKEQAGHLAYGLYSSSTPGGRPSGHVFVGGSDMDTAGTSMLPTGAWSHLAATYDGSTLRIFVNGTQVGSRLVTGPILTSSGPLRIGGNQVWGEYFSGLIDEVRIYDRALTTTQINADMTAAVQSPDSEPPSTPTGLSATGGLGQASLSWSASSDNVGVDHYDVHRGSSAGFTVSAANRIGQASGTSYTDQSAPAGTWHYRVVAVDAAGNASTPSASASAVVTGDQTAPTVSISAPSAGATVSGVTNLRATASDNVAVAGVRFRVDGADVGSEDTNAPFELAWDSRTVSNGSHTVTAVARDGAGNTTTSAPVTINVSNTASAPEGLVAAYGFEETGGSGVTDSSGNGNNGTISGATRSTAGRFGGALSFDGVNDLVTVPDSASLDLTTGMTLSAWVRPTVGGSAWRTVVLKEQPNNLVYGLYSTSSNTRPSGHAYVRADTDVRGNQALPTNAWSHLAVTFNGSTLRIFVNGAEVGSRQLNGTIAVSNGRLSIGGNQPWGEWYAGLIDEVRIYNRALSAADLQADMARPAP